MDDFYSKNITVKHTHITVKIHFLKFFLNISLVISTMFIFLFKKYLTIMCVCVCVCVCFFFTVIFLQEKSSKNRKNIFRVIFLPYKYKYFMIPVNNYLKSKILTVKIILFKKKNRVFKLIEENIIFS